MRRRGADLAFAVLVAGSVGVLVLAVLVWKGVLVHDEPNLGMTQRTTTAAPPAPHSSSRPTTTPARSIPEPAAQSRARLQLQRVVIVATRGDCWVSAHLGSPTGPVLAERLLNEGERLEVRGRTIVLELGASGNVDLSVNGRPRRVPLGTVSLTFS